MSNNDYFNQLFILLEKFRLNADTANDTSSIIRQERSFTFSVENFTDSLTQEQMAKVESITWVQAAQMLEFFIKNIIDESNKNDIDIINNDLN